jgi:TorA maturation chaperone TorD
MSRVGVPPGQIQQTEVSMDNTNTVIDKTTTDKELLIAILNGRKDFYLTLAGFYFKPLVQEQIDTMAAADFSGFGAGEPLLEEGFNDIWRYLRKRNTGTRQLLAVDFTSSFGGAATWKGCYAIPSASLFLSDKNLLYQGPRNEVYNIYKKAALKLKSGVDIAEDHLSFELEFLSILSERSIQALENDDLQTALDNLALSKDFINQQILTWFKQLSHRASLLIETRFYRGVLKITEGYLLLDLQTIDDLIEEIDKGFDRLQKFSPLMRNHLSNQER